MKIQQSKSLFEALYEAAERNKIIQKKAKESLDWYRKKISSIFGSRAIQPIHIFEKRNYPNKPIMGNIVTFRYRPKYDETLPYYDTFPLVLILKVVRGGFIGLNFHYLSPIHRAYFMDLLYRYRRYSSATSTVQINIKYETLKNTSILKYYRPCIKRYLNSNINTMFYTLSPDEWDIALFLPTERFVNENKEQVWKDSAKIIGKK